MVAIDLCTIIHAPIKRCFDLSRSIELHLLGTEQTGEKAIGGVTKGLIGPGDFVRWSARHLGIQQTLTSKITAYEYPVYFQDTMIEGAFRFMQHDHRFREIGQDATEMKDHFVLVAPYPILGYLAERALLKRYMRKFLQHRNEILKQAAESDDWRSLLPPN